MNDTLRNQLLGLGFKPAPEPTRPAERSRDGRPDRKAADARHGRRLPNQRSGAAGNRADKPTGPAPSGAGRPEASRSGAGRPGQSRGGKGRPASGDSRSREDIDLAKAYAIRAQREKDERIAAEKARQEEARLRREARARLAELVKDKALNDEAADIARHFPYGGKIKRIHVTADQLKALNAGELGVLQMDGRYLLVTAELLAQAEQIFAPSVALKVDPDAPAADDPYADPQYQVPDDLVW
ncbi:nucleoprotein/polynucleotide-associated enzyme [Lysobacter concretionis Ko07 = DSM 16239]|uniref:Nucleoprotein/polynucleotide-associated enzyme n=1 Tax=Lysobacter concretionis Ko07 = DSM 16239 TaxID=1122185 RepID=A0A0A0ENY7_9GAMM|nr:MULTISPECIES: DUF2058 family protein [Lysobacter]KGM52149.1 nucleoprotein/polynucleotide-associated enzyme [Lysobacter concretionis Ko07 = DSM 16239]QOD90109.1 DUF2058 family protein [Lysobacter sp. CW239]